MIKLSEFFSGAFLLKFIKFCLVGFSGVFVDFGFTFLFKEVFKVQKYVANAIGFTIAATSNYFFKPHLDFPEFKSACGAGIFPFFRDLTDRVGNKQPDHMDDDRKIQSQFLYFQTGGNGGGYRLEFFDQRLFHLCVINTSLSWMRECR